MQRFGGVARCARSIIPVILVFMGADPGKEFERHLKKAPEPATSRKRWHKRRAKNLEFSEIFEQVNNSPVVVRENGQKSQKLRMEATIEMLVVLAIKGDLWATQASAFVHPLPFSQIR